MRQYTKENIKDISELEAEMVDVGYGPEEENGKVLQDYFEANPEIPITRETLRGFVNKNQHLFSVRTPMQRKYDAIVKTAGRTQTELDTLHALMQSTGRSNRVSLNGEDYFYNAAILLAQLQGR